MKKEEVSLQVQRESPDIYKQDLRGEIKGIPPGEPVWCVAHTGGFFFAGGPSGLFAGQKQGDSLHFWPVGETMKPVHGLCPAGQYLWVVSHTSLLLYASGDSWDHALELRRLEIPEPPRNLSWLGDSLWCVFSEVLFKVEPDRFEILEGPTSATFRNIVATPTGRIWAATSHGLWYSLLGNWSAHYTSPNGLLSNDVRDIALDNGGILWIATSEGVNLYDGQEAWDCLTPKEGLPFREVKRVILGPEGSRWFILPEGCARLQEGRWTYFASQRWLPNDKIFSLTALGGEGDERERGALIGTEEGLSWIRQVPFSLEEKARIFEKRVRDRHCRYGYIAECRLRNPGDLQDPIPEATDNDGLWTSLYVAAESFRYGVTGEPEAQKNAWEAMEALLRLEEKTGIPGFPARAFVFKEETEVIQSEGEWHEAPDGSGYWKGDTSSDELAGHFFAYYIFSEICATEEQKTRVAETASRIAHHLIDHGFHLVDLDGEPTRWGVFSPSKLNHDPDWSLEKGLNALQILSHLKVASSLNNGGPEEKFSKAYFQLAERYHYALNTLRQKITQPEYINHSDDELAFLSYYPLLMLEDHPDLRALYLLSLEWAWQIERPERNPLFNFIYAVCSHKRLGVEEGMQTLQEIPMDLITWRVENSRRDDIRLECYENPAGRLESRRVLSPAERAIMKWNGNPYLLDGGDGGWHEDDGTFFLLPYWMGRYYHLIP